MFNIDDDKQLNPKDLWIDLAHKCLHYKGEKIFLPGVRYSKLMHRLIKDDPHCVNRADIMTAVWGKKPIDPTNVDKTIDKLNLKLSSTGLHIRNETGVGYRIERIQEGVRPEIDRALQTNTGATADTRVPVEDVDAATSEVSGVAVQFKRDQVLDAELAEQTYFKYRDERVEAVHTSDTSRALAARYACDPVSIGNQIFPVAILWQNKSEVIHPDSILRTLDFGSSTDPLVSSPTLDETQYALARLFIQSKYTRGKIKHEALEYCMTSIDLTGSLPRIDGRFGLYYDNILTQYAMEWELKKALKIEGHLALARGRIGTLPLREAIEFGRNPLLNGMGRCTAMTVSMLMVFERPGQGLWTLIHKRSIKVGLSAGMLHVVPAGMFEVKNPREKWSALKAVKREMLEEVYDEEEQQGGEAGFEDSLEHKKPVPFLSQLIDEKKAELSLTGICCDLLNLRPEICTVLYVPVAGLTEDRDMHVNWEYERPGPRDNFGTPWDLVEVDMQKVRVGEMVPSGVACFELGRTWLRTRHGV
jgi:DNA-binding winged helix-turn-helix (wHTH) protein